MESYLQIISNLLISLDKDKEGTLQAQKLLHKIHRGAIFDLYKGCTSERLTKTGDVMNEFMEQVIRLSNIENLDFEGSNGYSNKQFMDATDKSELVIATEALQNLCMSSNPEKASVNSTKINLVQTQFQKLSYSYGRSFVLDRNELFYMMMNYYYDQRFTENFIAILGKYNLEMSLLDSERSLVASIHDLFSFVSSLGHDGYLGSIHDKIPPSIKSNSNELNYGFSFFTLVGAKGNQVRKEEFNSLKTKLIEIIGRFSADTWNSLRDDLKEFNEYHLDFNKVIAKSFSQKLDFLKSILHAMIYLCNLDHSEIENFQGGAGLIESRGFEDNKDMEDDEEGAVNVIRNISQDILQQLEKLIYERTRLLFDLPTEEILLDNVLEFTTVFLNNVVECQALTDNSDRSNKFLWEIGTRLAYLLDYNDDKHYESTILLYEQLIRVLDDKIQIISLFRMSDSIVLKKIMFKITQKDCSEAQYLTSIKFMIAYSSLADGANHLFEERVINALVSAHCLKNMNEEECYESQERNNKHILWLWTLHLMRQLTSMLIHDSEYTYNLIFFINAYEKRIVQVLNFKGYVDGKKQFKKFSLAKIEEIEHIINLISF
jgi:hypothetical protein